MAYDGTLQARTPVPGAREHNKFVAADGAGTKQLIANRTAIDEWEIFDFAASGSHSRRRTADPGSALPLQDRLKSGVAWHPAD